MITLKQNRFFIFLICLSFLALIFFNIHTTSYRNDTYSIQDFYDFEKAAMALNDEDKIDSYTESLNSKSFNSLNSEDTYSTFYLQRLITIGDIDNYYGATKVVDGYKNISILCYDSIEQTEIAYQKLSQNDDVMVFIDKVITTADYSDNSYLGNMNWGYSAMNAGGINDYLKTHGTSEDVVVVVLDTGANTSHEILKDRFLTENGQIVGYSYYTSTITYSGYSFEDDHGHGSHVSGIITSSTPDNVKILPIKVLNSLGSGTFQDVLLALERIQTVYSSKYNICCLNLSLGGVSDVYTLSLLDSWFSALKEQNILSIVAAGNDKVDTAGYMPANSDNVITVSALKQDGNSYIFDDSYSNFGESVDIAAPGTMIASAYYKNNLNYDYVYMSGTSMAAPHVSAAVALLCSDSKYWSGSTPTYTADTIESRLYKNTTDLGEPGKDIFYGYGMLDLKYFNVENSQDVLTFKNASGSIIDISKYTEFTGSFTLNVVSSESGYQIFYTTDGSTPSKRSYMYTSPITVTNSVIYKFIALKIVNGSTVASSIIYTVELFNPDDNVENFFVIDENNVIVKYTGHFENLTIPQTIDGKTVQALGNYLFYKNNVVSVNIPDTCQTINAYCFSNCENLTNITFNNVSYLGAFAFENCSSLREINIDSITELAPKDPNYAVNGHVFDGCLSLQEIYLPYIETMGSNNFESSSIKKVYIGPSLSSYNNRAIDSGITVYGYSGTTAQTYCNSYGNTFIALDELKLLSDLPTSKTISQYSNENIAVIASGFKLTYQWYKTNSTISNGVALAGETNSTLQIDTTTVYQTKYFVKISAWGGKSLYSSICSVSIEAMQGYVAQVYNGTNWQYYQSINDAVDESVNNSIIVLTDDTYLTAPLSIANDITIVAINNSSIYMSNTLQNINSIITINGNLTIGMNETTYQNLQLSNLYIDGQNNNFDTLFNLQGSSTLNIQSNVNIQNFALNYLITEQSNSSFNMYGGIITNINKIGSGSLIDVSNINLSGGTISSCYSNNGNLIDVTNGKLIIDTITIINNTFNYLIYSYYDGNITITGGAFGNNECNAILFYSITNNLNFNSYTNQLNLYGGVPLNNIAINDNVYDVVISDRGEGEILNGCVNISSGCQFTQYYIDNSENYFYINITDSLYDSLILNLDFYNHEAYLDEIHPIFILNNSAVVNTENLKCDGYKFVLTDQKNAIYLKDITIRHLYYVLTADNIITQDYYYGDVISLIDDPIIAGYDFIAWYQEQECINIFNLVTMPSHDVYAYAKWEIKTFYITSNCDENGSISPTGKISVEYGQDQLFTFVPNEGYHVKSVQVDGIALANDEFANNSYLFENIISDHSIYVEFEINVYTIIVDYNEYGKVSPSGTLTYMYGEEQTFNLTANNGAHIESIKIDGVDVDDETMEFVLQNGYFTQIITKNHEIFVEFALNEYVITASSGDNGSISPNGDTTLQHGTSQNYTITANKGYHLIKVEIDGISLNEEEFEDVINNGYTFSDIDKNHTIYVEFDINTYKIIASSSENGKISPSGESIVNYGDNSEYKIKANKGYKVENIYIDEKAVFTNSQGDIKSYNYSFRNIDSDHTIYVEFAKIKFNITINIEGDGKITSTQDMTSVDYGDYRLFRINTDFSNYDVEVYVNDDLVETSNNQFRINDIQENIEIDVKFIKKPFTSTTTGIIVMVSIGVIAAVIIISIPLSKIVKRKRMYKEIDKY